MAGKCIFFLADGARYDVFRELLQRGELENISKYIVEPGKLLRGVTVFPSTTGPAYTPYLMGKYPGRCNLPGIRWFDRRYYGKEVFTFRRFRSYRLLSLHRLRRTSGFGCFDQRQRRFEI